MSVLKSADDYGVLRNESEDLLLYTVEVSKFKISPLLC
jgi:hypothetical protein